MVDFSIKQEEGYTQLAFNGDLRLGSLAETGQKIRDNLKNAQDSVIINLSKVQYIDSTGMGLLVHTLHWARKNNRKLILAEMCPMVEKVFILTNLHRVFTIAKTEKEAIQCIHPKKVLLFESRDDVIFFYKEIIQANHLEFFHAPDADQAQDLILEHHLDLLIMEAQENDVEKYDLVRRMKQNEELANIPIVVLSVYEDEEFQFSQFGVDRFILKPFLVEKFVVVLKELLFS